MGLKRQDNGADFELDGRPDDAPVVAQVLRAAEDARHTDGKHEKKDEEKLSVFWRVFGGTLLSIGALIAITVYNNFTSTLSELRAELNKAHEARADLVRKDEFNSRLSNNYERLKGLEQQNSTQTATVTSLKTEVEGLKERLGKAAADLETARKDQAAAHEGLKKDLAALEVVKERLALAAADLKAARDDLVKLRQDVDKNQAYDLERRDRRDAQYKQLDETIKEFQKGLQDCREKLARLEGQYGPPGAAPKKANAQRISLSNEPETAPAPVKKDAP